MSYLLAIFPPDRDISPIINCFKQFDVQFEVQSTFEGLKPFAENYATQKGQKVDIKKEVESFPDVSERAVISKGGPVDQNLLFGNREPVYPSYADQMVLPHRIIVKKELEDVEVEMNCATRVKLEFNENLVPIESSKKRKWSPGVDANNSVQDPEEAAESFSTPRAHVFRSIASLVEEDVRGGDFDDEKSDHGQDTDFMNAVGDCGCPVDGCSVKLDSPENLAEHMKEHSAPWLCGICKRCCPSGSALRIHYRMHTGEKPFKCKICEKSFARKGQLKLHQRNHTGDREYKCLDCGFKTNDYISLKIHQLTHTGERPYPCTICKKDFTHASTFNAHMRTHTGERSFECDICGVKLATNYTLKEHKRTHSGEKPYSCPTCGFKTAYARGLTKHKMKFSH